MRYHDVKHQFVTDYEKENPMSQVRSLRKADVLNV
jgi:hypothetical protein